MHVTPFIREIRLEGGTFYTFGSASEDLTFTQNNDKKKFKFSKFALLKLPDLGKPSLGQNFIQVNAPPGAYQEYGPVLPGDLNTRFAESFQNYCLNLETMITAQDNYDASVDRSVSERVFWKWIKELGGIRFREATSDELAGTSFGARFVEEDRNSDPNGGDFYDRVVQYVGDINVTNALRNKFNAYQEVYIHVPTSHGSTADILFNSIEDANYAPDSLITNNPADPLDDEVIYGRSYDDIHPEGLSIKAHYGSEGTFNEFWSSTDGITWTEYDYSDTSNGFVWWYSTPKDATFYTEPGGGFGNSSNDYIAQGSDIPGGLGQNYVSLKRNKLDGITIEWDTDAYAKIAEANNIENFGQFNASQYATNFDYNAVLVYYDIYDPERTEDSATNLFGVLFLDNVDPLSTGGGRIESLPKIKPDELNQTNGNAWGLKLNMKWDLSASDSGVEVTINDYNTYSLELYIDAMNSMQNVTDTLSYHLSQYDSILEELNSVKDVVYTTDNLDSLSKRIAAIETSLSDAYAVLLSNETLTQLILRNYDEITNIYKNYTSIEMTYNLDSIQQGAGVNIDRNEKNRILISNSNEGYNLGEKPLVSIVSDFDGSLPNQYSYEYSMVDFDNFLRITDGDIDELYTISRNLILRLDDTKYAWTKGKRMRLTFEYGLDMNNTNGDFNLYIYTDAKDKLNSGFFYSKEVAVISSQVFDSKDGKPIFEIVCIDPDNFTFIIDVI